MNNTNTPDLSLKHIFLVSLGGMLELFDFTIYAILASYLGRVFFSASNPTTEMLNTFLVFALGYCARPIGGILFSHFGDRYGRKNAFQSSIFIMAAATLLVAFLPTYHQIGILAPLLLILIRLLQGISLGGEIPGASVFAFEHCKQKPGLAIGIIFMSLTMGNVIAVLLIQFLKTILSDQQMLLYGWRLAFVFGSVIGVIGFILRRNIKETPDFAAYKHWLTQQANRPIPIVELFKKSSLLIVSSTGLISLSAAGLFLMLSLPTYLSSVSKLMNVTFLNLMMFVTLSIFVLISGALSDRINRSFLLVIGAITTAVFGALFFVAVQSANIAMIWVCAILFSIAFSLFNGNYICSIASSFPVGIRYSGTAISYNLGFALFMGIAPLFQVLLNKYFPITTGGIILFAIFSTISILSVLMAGRFPKFKSTYLLTEIEIDTIKQGNLND